MTAIKVPLIQRTPEWLEFRRKGGPGNPYPCAVGCSDLRAIMYGGPDRDELWRRLSGFGQEKEATPIMKRGVELEPDIIAGFQSSTGLVTAPAVYYNSRFPWLVASLDGDAETEFGPVVVEAKLHGLGDHTTVMAGKVPDHHFWQLQGQLLVREAKVGYLVSGKQTFPKELDVRWCRYTSAPAETVLRLQERVEEFVKSVADGIAPWARRAVVDLAPAAEKPAPAPRILLAPDENPPVEVNAEPGADSAAIVRVPLLGQAPGVLVILEGWLPKRDEIVTKALATSITNQEEADNAGAVLKNLTQLDNGLEDARKKAGKPYVDAKQAIDDAVKDFGKPIRDAKGHVQSVITGWMDRCRLEREAAERERRRAEEEAARKAAEARKTLEAGDEVGAMRAAKEAEAAKAAASQWVVPEKRAVANAAGGREPSLSVIDPDSVDRAYCVPSESLLKAKMKSLWKSLGHDEERFLAACTEQLKGVAVTISTKAKAR